jgi:hypothetical protein
MKKILLTLSAIAMLSLNPKAQTNYLDNYIGNTVTLTTVGSSSDQVLAPRDLDFKPNSNELWVMNYGDGSGGSFVIFYNAGLPDQWSEYRRDTHAGHFMIYPSAFAFGDNGEWANVNEIQSTGGPTSTFMGPSLWLSDTNIFARVFQSNWASGYPLGSHIDMLHQSPFAMGIAHDSLKAYWVMDGYNGTICKYDYVNDHGPGYEDHSAGEIYRYVDVPVTRVDGVPSHMVLDKSSGWLYYIDGISKQIRRMDSNSGSVTGTLATPSTAPEALAGYYKMEFATVETLATLSTQPSGIDYYNGRLVVSDYETGDLYLYSTSPFALLDTIVTGQANMMGVKVGPDGHIWAVNNVQNKVYRLDVAAPATDLAITLIISPKVENFTPRFYSPMFDVCSESISPIVIVKNNGTNVVTSANIQYTVDGGTPVVYSWAGSLNSGAAQSVSLPSLAISNGGHLLSVQIVSVNGAPDEVDLNNTLDGAFRSVAPAVTLPFTEGFTTNVFPPVGWNYVNHNKHNKMLRATVGGFAASVGSMKMNNFYREMNITSQADYLMSPVINMSTATSNSWLRFNVAYARYNSTTNDELQVRVSTDCGNSWDTVYSKAGTVLATAPNTTSAFTPTSAQWRTDSVSMGSYAGEAEVLVMFTSISNYGNNLYVDDILIGDFSTGISDNNSGEISIYPNPSRDMLTINSNNNFEYDEVRISNLLGELLMEKQITSPMKSMSFNIGSLAPGYYIISLRKGNAGINKSFIKN